MQPASASSSPGRPQRFPPLENGYGSGDSRFAGLSNVGIRPTAGAETQRHEDEEPLSVRSQVLTLAGLAVLARFLIQALRKKYPGAVSASGMLSSIRSLSAGPLMLLGSAIGVLVRRNLPMLTASQGSRQAVINGKPYQPW